MNMSLPVRLQRWIRGLPQWSPVGVKQPEEGVRIRMSSARGECDITCGIVVAALKPLTLAIAVTEQTRSVLADRTGPHLQFIDLESGRTVGTLQLNHLRDWDTSGFTLGIFEVRDGRQRCLRWPYRSWNRWLQDRAMQKNTNSDNFSMPPESVQQLMIFYICPRPVVLVSVDDGRHSNLFPMDLIGPVAADRFTLALRSTSQSIATMRSARRVALSDIPAGARSIAYKLGIHHKNVKVDWDRLPFEIHRSREFSLPYPAIALRVREFAILDFTTIGSHTFFVTQLASEQSAAHEAQFFHTSGIYQHFRKCRGRPFASASSP